MSPALLFPTQREREREMEGKAELDPEEVFCLAEQMIDVEQQRASDEVSFLGESRADLFHTSLGCQEDRVKLLDLQKRIAAAEHALEDVQNADHSSLSISDLQKQRDDLLHHERSLNLQARSLQDTLENFSKQRLTLQSRKELLKNREMRHDLLVLSFYTSVFRMIGSDGGDNAIAGSLLDSKGCVVDNFKFDTEHMDAFDVSEKLWNLCMTNQHI